jgi:hypothetical protein
VALHNSKSAESKAILKKALKHIFNRFFCGFSHNGEKRKAEDFNTDYCIKKFIIFA